MPKKHHQLSCVTFLTASGLADDKALLATHLNIAFLSTDFVDQLVQFYLIAFCLIIIRLLGGLNNQPSIWGYV